MDQALQDGLIGPAPDDVDESAPTRDAAYKWVVVVDRDLPAGRAANAAICVTGATVARTRGVLGRDAVDSDGAVHPGLPWIGCTVLGASADRVAEVRARGAAAPGVVTVDMPTQAQHTRVYADYLHAVSRTRTADLSYYAVSLFGPRSVVDRITKGLSLLA